MLIIFKISRKASLIISINNIKMYLLNKKIIAKTKRK